MQKKLALACCVAAFLSSFSASADTAPLLPGLIDIPKNNDECSLACYRDAVKAEEQCIAVLGGHDTPDKECAREKQEYYNDCSDICDALHPAPLLPVPPEPPVPLPPGPGIYYPNSPALPPVYYF